jgi:hypothetical protein
MSAAILRDPTLRVDKDNQRRPERRPLERCTAFPNSFYSSFRSEWFSKHFDQCWLQFQPSIGEILFARLSDHHYRVRRRPTFTDFLREAFLAYSIIGSS